MTAAITEPTARTAAAVYFHRDGDPRTRFPALLGVLPEANYVAWEQSGLCLCGCGEKTRPRRPERPDCVEVNYWVIGHYATLRAEHGLYRPSPRTFQQRLAASRYNISQCIDGVAVLELVREHIDEHFDGSITRFAKAHGLEHSSLCYNLNRGKTRITKKRAKQLLLLIGEKPHPSLG